MVGVETALARRYVVTMDYQPLCEVRDSLKVNWYRSKFKPEKLRELSKRSDLQGWFQAGGHLVIFAITGGLAYLFWSQENWLGFFIALFAHGRLVVSSPAQRRTSLVMVPYFAPNG